MLYGINQKEKNAQDVNTKHNKNLYHTGNIFGLTKTRSARLFLELNFCAFLTRCFSLG